MRPSLLLDFANTRRLDPRIVFTRAGTATYFDRLGVLKTAGINEPRFDFDPVTGYCKGLLIEEARTNLLTYSSQFDNAAWSKVMSVTADAALGPDGLMSADRLVPTTSSTNQYIMQSVSPAASVDVTFSVFLKAGGYDNLVLYVNGTTSGTPIGRLFSLTAGTVTAGTLDAGGYATNAFIQDKGAGWYRCGFTIPASQNDGSLIAALRYTAGSASYVNAAGDGASGIYAWGAQLEVGSFATSSIPTSSATVTRAAEVASMTGDNFSQWFNPAEGAFAASFVSATGNGPQAVFSATDGTASNRIAYFSDSAVGIGAGFDKSSAVISKDGAAVYSADTEATVLRSAKYVATFAYKAGSAIASSNGALSSPGTPTAIPTVSQFSIGGQLTSNYINGHLARLAYYPRRLSNSDLQELTR